MYDVIEKIGKSTIQHGKYNNRIYLMNLNMEDYPGILDKLNQLAIKRRYTKIFAKVPSLIVEAFEGAGYAKEATIPSFYSGNKDTCLVSKFLDNSRAKLDKESKENISFNLKLAIRKQGKTSSIHKNPNYQLRQLNKDDLDKLTNLYSNVFESYPFPIFEREYIEETMEENIVYFGVFYRNKLIAASSSEIDSKFENAEMTDFATDPNYSGNNLSLLLLQKMEIEMKKRGIKTLYTIARSFSPGMNITFAKQDYNYSGTLVNNTNISGQIESMNVWYKSVG